MLTMDTKEPVALSHQFRKAIRNFTKDLDITEDHLDIIKREMFGEFFSSMNSLEFIAMQYDAFEMVRQFLICRKFYRKLL